MKNTLMIGCVADDYTGASDAASFLISFGLKTLLFNGIPTGDIPECNAVVIALKSRTQDTKEAVKDSMEACEWLVSKGAQHLYFKYCSTFDSTREGNIGPVLDAMIEKYQQKHVVISPALPVNGRKVKDGILYVNDVPLSETHMANHPLTPMWTSKLADLMEPQGKYPSLELNHETLEKSPEEIMAIVEEFGKDKEHFYIIPDYVNDENGAKVAAMFGGFQVLSGGSGILAHLSERYKKELNTADSESCSFTTSTEGRGLVLSGSCSKATMAQILDYNAKGHPTKGLVYDDLASGKVTVDSLWSFIEEHKDEEVLIYSMGPFENVSAIAEDQKAIVAATYENTSAELAKRAVDAGFTRIVIAGGDTSSAVAQKLGFDGFEIGESVAPGVPVMMPLSNKNVRIVLKSGNFGQEDFFERALNLTKSLADINSQLDEAIFVAHNLFARGKVSGSSANMSVKIGKHVYMTGTGTCFGTLKKEDFAILTADGEYVSGVKPSKELPLHLMMYQKDEKIRAVLHTHTFYSTLWSCLDHAQKSDCVPEYTPYLKMKLGTVGLVPYAKPGTESLFQSFKNVINNSDGFLLANHGPLVGGKSVLDAFYCLEELEESCKIAWEIEGRSKQALCIQK